MEDELIKHDKIIPMMINNRDKWGLIKTVIILIIVLFSVEIHLETKKLIKAKSRSLNNESTEKSFLLSSQEVIDSLNNNGCVAYPEIGGMRFFQEEITSRNNFEIFPLAGISNTKTVFLDNTAGKITFVQMDEHGFNNKKGLYNSDDVDICLIGNCMWEEAGMLNPYEENIGELLRKKGFKTLNLAKGGSTPILQYAVIKEYVEPMQSKVVLFQIRSDNILFDDPVLMNANLLEQSILNKYMQSNDYSQRLLSKQVVIDSILVNFILNQRRTSLFVSEEYLMDISSVIIRILKMSNLRTSIKIKYQREQYKLKSVNSFQSNYTKMIVKTNALVNAYGGKLYLVYQPQIEEFLYGKKNKIFALTRDIAAKYDIPIIDLNKEVFAAHPDPRSLLPYREDPHPNAEANKLTADAIEMRLVSDEVLKPR